jgi:transposase InsO family protein
MLRYSVIATKYLIPGTAFQALLHSWQMIPSMSGQGHCYDNAAMEAFWSTLKTEWVHLKEFSDLAAARRPCSITSKPFITENGSTALSVLNHLWNLNKNYCIRITSSPSSIFSREAHRGPSLFRPFSGDRPFSFSARIHMALRVPPAMEAGVSDHVWSLEEIVNLI